MRSLKRKYNSYVGFGIAAIAAALCLAALASDTSQTETPVAVDAEQYADFIENEVFDIQDLAEGAEIQRRRFNRMTPPGFSWVQPMFPSVVPFDSENFDEKFLDELLGEDKNSVAIYPLSLTQDPKTRETLVFNADGKLIATIPADRMTREWPENADPARVTLLLDLLPAEDVEPYLYTESRIEESLSQREIYSRVMPGEAMARSLGANEFGFAGAHRLTNGQMRLTATNGMDVAEIYSYTVWHTSPVVVTVWTNEYDEVVTRTNLVWGPTSPPYAGIESEWECRTTNLVLAGGVGRWDDADVSTNARVRFYAAAQRMDSDGDGLSDGMEIFLYRTDPGQADSDGDGVGDGMEVGQGGDPLDPAEYPVDPDMEAALAGINVAQIGYLSYLCDLSFAYDPSTNYAQRIQTLQEALEGLAGSFLDLDVNVDGVLAERTNAVVWTLDAVLSSTGNESGDWLEGLATTSQVEEIATVLGQLTHLVCEGSAQTGYSHQGVVTQAVPFRVGSPWDLGTGYPERWPTNQPIKTYLLLDTKIDIPNVGPGTVDDWIEVNGTARFPSYGEIYLYHVADISAPTWEPSGTNLLELWDCGDCAGPNDYAYLSPFKVVQVLEAPVLKVEFDHRPGKVCYGFDPPESLLNDTWPWTSVDKDGTNEVCRLVVEPVSLADQIEIVIASGSSSAAVTPTNFTAGTTDLTILGQGLEGHAIAEARIKGTSTICAKLNIRSQQKETLSVGVYYIQDTNSPATCPVVASSANEILDTMNDVFQQAQIEFTLEESYTTNIAYDANTNGLVDESELAAVSITGPQWKGDYRVLLMKNSGIYYDQPSYATNWLVRGQASDTGAILFAQDLGACVSLAAAHEVGHVLEIPIEDSGPIFHDGGPWPSGEESLMRSGIEPSGPVNCPGRWLRHEDWKEANDLAETFQ